MASAVIGLLVVFAILTQLNTLAGWSRAGASHAHNGTAIPAHFSVAQLNDVVGNDVKVVETQGTIENKLSIPPDSGGVTSYFFVVTNGNASVLVDVNDLSNTGNASLYQKFNAGDYIDIIGGFGSLSCTNAKSTTTNKNARTLCQAVKAVGGTVPTIVINSAFVKQHWQRPAIVSTTKPSPNEAPSLTHMTIAQLNRAVLSSNHPTMVQTQGNVVHKIAIANTGLKDNVGYFLVVQYAGSLAVVELPTKPLFDQYVDGNNIVAVGALGSDDCSSVSPPTPLNIAVKNYSDTTASHVDITGSVQSLRPVNADNINYIANAFGNTAIIVDGTYTAAVHNITNNDFNKLTTGEKVAVKGGYMKSPDNRVVQIYGKKDSPLRVTAYEPDPFAENVCPLLGTKVSKVPIILINQSLMQYYGGQPAIRVASTTSNVVQ